MNNRNRPKYSITKISRCLNFTPTKDKNTNKNKKRYKSNEICHDEKSNLKNHKHTDERDKSEYIQVPKNQIEHLYRTRHQKK